jgi:glutamate carboxypeptidase
MNGNDALQRCLQSRAPAALDLLERMVGINSWTFNREGVNELGRLTSREFALLGFRSTAVPSSDPAWGDHLFLTRNGRTPRAVAMISHLDTVFSPEEEAKHDFRWQEETDRIYGPGTSDIKGGTVMMHLVLSAIRETLPELFADITWQLMLNASEETRSEQFGELCLARLSEHTLAALVFESEGTTATPVKRLVTSRKGRLTFRIAVAGRGAHAGSKHHLGANAIVQLGETVRQVANLTDYRQDLTFNVGMVSGGTAFNRVPHEAVAEGEMRAFAPEPYQAGKSALLAFNGQGSVRSADGRYPCAVTVTILDETPPWPENPQTDALFRRWQQTAAGLGVHVEPEARGGISDGNLLWQTVATLDGLGPAGDNCHCSERSADGSKMPEFVEPGSFVPKALLNVLAIRDLAQDAS